MSVAVVTSKAVRIALHSGKERTVASSSYALTSGLYITSESHNDKRTGNRGGVGNGSFS